jgi:glutathione S-transferase
MYKLYGSLGAASLTPQCVLEESGLPYEFIEVDISEDTERDPEYLKLNPHGRIPTLVIDDQVMIESAAISIYLADKHSHTQLSPPLDHPERSHYLQWMVYLTNTLQETLLLKMYSSLYTDDPQGYDATISRATSKLDTIMSFVENSLSLTEGPFFLGNGLSTADIYLNMLTGWDPTIQVRILSSSTTADIPKNQRYTNIERNYSEMLKRPGVAKTFSANGY